MSTAFPLIRYEFELLAQLSFILSDKENFSEKSMIYYYCDVRQRFLPSEDNSGDSYMKQSRIFHKIHANLSLIDNHKKMSWYGLYERKNITFKSLCEKVGLEKFYLKLYPHLSSDVHGTSCLEANTKCFEDGGKYYLQRFRIFERHHTVMTQHIDFMRQAFNLFPKVFEVSKELQDKITDFYKRSDIYVEAYSSIKNSPIDPLSDYAM